MPVINVPNLGPVNFPDTMPQDEIKARFTDLAQRAASKFEYKPDYRELGLGQLIKGGFNRSLSAIGSGITDVAPAMIGSALGYEDYAKEQMAEAAAKRQRAELENPTGFRSYKEIRGPGDVVGFGAETLGEIGPDILGMLVPGGVGSALGRRVAMRGAAEAAGARAAESVAAKGLAGDAAEAYTKRLTDAAVGQAGRAGAETGLNVGMYAGAYGLNTPETFQGIYEKTGEFHPGIAATFGAAIAALDTVLPSYLLKQLSPAAKGKLASELVNRSSIVEPSIKAGIAKSAGRAAFGEGGTEVIQEGLNILAEKTAGASGEFFSPENVDRLINAGLKGAIGGGVLGTPGGVREAYAERAAAREEIARRAALPEATPSPEAPPAGPVDYDRPAVMRRPDYLARPGLRETPLPETDPNQLDMFPGEKARFSLDEVRAARIPEPGSSLVENIEVAKLKLGRGDELTNGEIQLLVDNKLVTPTEAKNLPRATEEVAPPEVLPGQQTLPGMSTPELAFRDAAFADKITQPELPLTRPITSRLDVAPPPQQEQPAPPPAPERGEQPELDLMGGRTGAQLKFWDAVDKAERNGGVPLPFPGMPIRGEDLRRRLEGRPEPKPDERANVLTPEVLAALGVTPQMPAHKRTIGKSLDDPQEREQVASAFRGLAKNKQVPQETRDKLTAILKSPLFATQPELNFESPPATPTPSVPVTPPSGASPSVPSEPGPVVPPGGTATPPATGVETTEPPATPTGVGATEQPGTVENFEVNVEDGLNTEYPNVGSAMFRYTQNGDVKGIDEAVADIEYPAYLKALHNLLKEMFPSGVIPVRHRKEYAGFEDTGEGLMSVSINPNWGGKSAQTFNIAINDVVAAGNGAEGELIIRRPTTKSSAVEETEDEAEAGGKPRAKSKTPPELLQQIREKAQDRKNRVDFGDKTGAVKTDSDRLKGRRDNRKLAPAVEKGDLQGVLDALANSKNVFVRKVAELARKLKTKIVIDNDAEETYTVKDPFARSRQITIDSSKTHVELLDLLRGLKADIEALPDDRRISKATYAITGNRITYYEDGKPVGTHSVEDLIYGKKANPLPLYDYFTPNPDASTKQNLLNLLSKMESITEEIGENRIRLNATASAEQVGVAGTYDASTDTIRVPEYYANSEHVLTHEITHALAVNAIANPTLAQRPSVQRLNALYEHVKKAIQAKKLEPYGITNLQEFVAEAWSNPDFQYELSKIEYQNQTAWSKFAQFIADLLGLKNDTALTEALSATEELLSLPQGKTKAKGTFKLITETPSAPSPKPAAAPATPQPSAIAAAVRGTGTVNANVANAAVDPKGKSAVELLDSFTQALTKLPFITQQRADAINQFLRDTVDTAGRSFLLMSMPLNALTEVAERYLPGAKQIAMLDRLKSGDEYARNKMIEPIVLAAEKWAAAYPKLVDAFNRTVYRSTIAGVDPSKPGSAYYDKPGLPKLDKDGNDLAEAWRDLQADYKAIGPGGQKLYGMMRDTYASMYEEIKKAIVEKISSTTDNADLAKKISGEVLAKLAAKGGLDPYFPLTRYGNFWVSYKTKGGPKLGQADFFIRAFETEVERERFIKTLEATDEIAPRTKVDEETGKTITEPPIQRFSQISEISYKNTPANSFVNGVLKVMEVNKVPEDAKEQILRLFLSTLPETSFAQAFQQRGNVAGFEHDAIRALREKSFSMSRQLSNMKYAYKLISARDDLRKNVKAMGKGEGATDNRIAKEYYDEIDKRVKFIISPETSKLSQLLTSFGFTYLLGFNVSSAVINLTQVPLIVLPYLGGKYGFSETTKALGNAYKVFANTGIKETAILEFKDENGKDVKVKSRAMPSIENLDINRPGDTPEAKKERELAAHYKELIEEGTLQGQLNRSALYDILDVSGAKNPLTVVNAASGWMFHHAERMNRQIALMAAYDLELGKTKNPTTEDKVAAAKQAIYVSELTNGGTTATSAPRIAQGSIGRVLFMFKRYGASMYYLLAKNFNEAIRAGQYELDGLKAELAKTKDAAKITKLKKQIAEAEELAKVNRGIARRQLGATYASAALFSGLQGLPLFGVLSVIYNMFADDDDDDMATAVRKSTGELAYKGLVNALTNMDVASRVSLTGLIIRDNKLSSGSQTVAEAFGDLMGGPVYGIATKVERGVKQIRDGQTERGIENILPSGLGNVLKGFRYATSGTTTLRGDAITGDVNPANAIAQAFGFAPADYTRQLEITAREKGMDKAATADRTKFLNNMYIAKRFHDTEGVADARADLERLYAKHPGFKKFGTLDETIARSMRQHALTTEQMKPFAGVTISKAMRDEILQDMQEFE